ncbi:MAG: rod shape-determining protein RodA [Alphaproteobacteria bacterium]
MALLSSAPANDYQTLTQRLLGINWLLLALVTGLALTGIAMLYSAGEGFDPWASRQAMRYAVCVLIMLAVAVIDLRLVLKLAYLIYFITLALLIGVEAMGSIGMGAQRWIDLGLIRIQPSELMKIALVLALARYFHGCTHLDLGKLTMMVPPLLLAAVPIALVLKQPDLGTAGMLGLGAAMVFFVAGVRLWMFGIAVAAFAATAPVAWTLLHEYQRQRVLTFLEPELDPLGSGYHILQSQIALGSGGLFGRGFMQGTQSHLSFLPEKQTDFVFTMLAEEFGLVGGLTLIALYMMVIAFCVAIAMRAHNQFGRILALGIASTLFLYVFINIAMVMGLLPVVGIPLPLISYGGTAMMTVMVGIGLVMNVYINRDLRIGRRHDEQD